MEDRNRLHEIFECVLFNLGGFSASPTTSAVETGYIGGTCVKIDAFLEPLTYMPTPLTPTTLTPTNRTMKVAAFSLAFAGLIAVAGLWKPTPVAAQSDPAPNTEAYYTQKVVPIIQANCARCHGGMNHRGGLSLDTRSGMLKGGHDGTVLVPGHPEQSLLIKLIRHEGPADDPMPMPPKSKISDADIATITAWVKAGAIVPASAQ